MELEKIEDKVEDKKLDKSEDNPIEQERPQKSILMKGPNIIVSGNKVSLAFKESGYETLILQPPMGNENSLIINLINGSGVRVGITLNDPSLNLIEYPVGMHKCQYSYRIKDGYKFNDGIGTKYGNGIKKSEPIRMLFINNELIFEEQGKSLGCAFKVLPIKDGKYYPAISIFQDAQVEFVYH
ncbi:unnamed protein product [Paramecium primaurelia]|uniref:Uncharacterized protein n=1 Tax=Paramecium primaurelia TaxID=5886 RepID=A0A8S1NSI7_PARPR|nr:unnamed protein product [Paramecium primaurelia]